MATEIEGMKVTIRADVQQAIRALQSFQDKFKSVANAINGTVIQTDIHVANFSDSIKDIGSLTNMAQLEKMQDAIDKINDATKKTENTIGKRNQGILTIKKTNESLKEQLKILDKNKKTWLAIGVAASAALYGIIRMSGLAQMWMNELTGIFTLFIDSALSPLSPLIEGILNVFWQVSDWFSGLDPIIQGAVGALGLLGVAFGIVVGFVSWLTGSTGLAIITGAFEAVSGAIVAIAAIIGLPVEAVIVIIAAVGVALYLLLTHWNEVWTAIGGLIDWLGRKVKQVVEGMFTIWQTELDAIKNAITIAWSGFWNIIDGLQNTITNGIKAVWNAIPNFIKEPLNRAYNFVVDIVNKIKDKILSVPGVSTAINMIGGAYQSASSYMGYAQGTDYVPATGLYKLHAGEAVVPANENSGSTSKGGNTINISPSIVINTPSINSNLDIRNLASQLSEYWKSDMSRFSRGVV